MDMTLKSGQREIVRIAMALLIKQCEKAKKLEESLRLSTAEVDALLSRAGLVLEAINVKAEAAVHLTFALRMTLRQGLAMYLEEVVGTMGDEMKLGIDVEGSNAKADEIKALAALIAEQRTLGKEIFDHIRDHAGEIGAELSTDDTQVTVSVR